MADVRVRLMSKLGVTSQAASKEAAERPASSPKYRGIDAP